MNQILTLSKMLSAIVLLAVAAGCATTLSTENMLVGAGFKVITPITAAQQRQLKALPPGTMTTVQRTGKTYYVFPDFDANQVYVGGPKQYQAYRQLRLQQKLAEMNLEAQEMDLEGWGGWGGWGPLWY